jgi:hypothetical protein
MRGQVQAPSSSTAKHYLGQPLPKMRDKFQTQIVRIVPELVYYLLSDEYNIISTLSLVIAQAEVFCLGGEIRTK